MARGFLKHIAIATAATALSLASGGAFASENARPGMGDFYLDISGGTVAPSDSTVSGSTNLDIEFDKGYGFSASLGYKPPVKRGFWHHTRFEGEASYKSADIDNIVTAGSGSVDTFSLMANAFYDFRNATSITPFIGFGMGITRINLNDNVVLGTTDETDVLPAYQLLAGLSYEPESTPYATLHLGYRYFETMGDAKFTSNVTGLQSKYDYASQAIELGLRLDF